MEQEKIDRRPDPKPRRYPHLWQAYLLWDELMQQRKRHLLRIASIEAGKSNLDADRERYYMERLGLEAHLAEAERELADEGELVGPIWAEFTGIRGIGDHTAAKILASIDNIASFDSVSKLWRFAGWAVIDGAIDRCAKGIKAPYNRRLKSEFWLAASNMVRAQTPGYMTIYYGEKDRQRELYPVPVCSTCGAQAKLSGKGEEHSWKCPNRCGAAIRFTPGHIDLRAKRKMVKILIQHLWVRWRTLEGLAVSDPWVIAHGGHVDYITSESCGWGVNT
jgi:predicted RNA-binding Zn-ribbon protein involved in translation (DUF1610 family)